ncbi:MAG: CoA transferase, partial [Burkholderiales bacterium]
SNGKRVENRDELARLLGAIFARRTKNEWVELLDAAGVPNGPINDIAQVFAEPQVKARGVRIEVDHPVAGKLPMVASPMRFSDTPLEHKRPPPLLGEQTEEILRGVLGMSAEDVARLRESGAI